MCTQTTAADTTTENTAEENKDKKVQPGYEQKEEARVASGRGDEDLDKFMSAAAAMSDIAKRNNWPLIISGFAPVKDESHKGIAAACVTNASGESMASTFSMMGLSGVMAAHSFQKMLEGASMMGRILELEKASNQCESLEPTRGVEIPN